MPIKITKKDRSLLLFLICTAIIFWFLFSVIIKAIFHIPFEETASAKIIKTYENQSNKWLNVARPLSREDVEDKIILLDFWTYACVNCLQAAPEIKKLEAKFGNKLLVIGVHSGKFDNEKDFESIKKAILKHKIEHPVIDDSDFKLWEEFKADAWPTFILIAPNGKIHSRFRGEGEVKLVESEIAQLIDDYSRSLNREEPPILLEKDKIIKTVLGYPTKMTYVKKFHYNDFDGEAFFISNSARNNILVVSKSGEVILQIGSKFAGYEDGALEMAKFNAPSGLLFHEDKLYVADTSNHAIREVDFVENSVKTLAGNGKRGGIVSANSQEAIKTSLASPTDLEFFPNKQTLAIANSGTHQILGLNLKNSTLKVLAGSGIEGIKDGSYPQNQLAQTSDLSAYGGDLYFLDSETSSLRVLNEEGEVSTLIGKGLFDFGDQDGDSSSALMQHPLGLFIRLDHAP